VIDIYSKNGFFTTFVLNKCSKGVQFDVHIFQGSAATDLVSFGKLVVSFVSAFTQFTAECNSEK